MPRRGSRVRSPSRAWKRNDTKSVSFFFSSPILGSKVRCLRSAPVRAGRGPPDLVRRLALFSCLHEVVDSCRQLILQRVPVGSLPPASTNRTASGKMTDFLRKINLLICENGNLRLENGKMNDPKNDSCLSRFESVWEKGNVRG